MYPVSPITLPSSLACARNGELPSSALTPIGTGGRLEHTAARAWAALYIAGMADGVGPFTWTPGGTYRTLSMQQTAFADRWSPVPQPGTLAPVTTFYNGGTYYLRTYQDSRGQWRYVARTARPGTSNHGLGISVDIALGASQADADPITPALPWLVRNAASLGWSWEAATKTAQEPWHLHYFAGDAIPQRVLDIEAFFAGLPK